MEGLHRAKITRFISSEPYMQVEIEEFKEDNEPKTPELDALMRTLISELEQYVRLSKKIPPETVVSVMAIEEPGRLADVIASHLSLRIQEKQKILEARDVAHRLELLCEMLATEMEVLELERKINIRVRKQMEKTQKEYYLREQMKAIQKELGDKDERVAEVEELKERINKAKLPKEAYEKAYKELERLEKMPPMVAEAVVVRNYLDWLYPCPGQ